MIIFKPLPKKHQLVYIMNSIIILSIITASSDINFSSIKRTKTLLAPCIQRNGANFSGVSIWGTKIKTKKHKIYKGLFTWIPCKTNGYYTNSMKNAAAAATHCKNEMLKNIKVVSGV